MLTVTTCGTTLELRRTIQWNCTIEHRDKILNTSRNCSYHLNTAPKQPTPGKATPRSNATHQQDQARKLKTPTERDPIHPTKSRILYTRRDRSEPVGLAITPSRCENSQTRPLHLPASADPYPPNCLGPVGSECWPDRCALCWAYGVFRHWSRWWHH